MRRAFFLFFALLVTATYPASAGSAPANTDKAKAPTASTSSEYVGSDTCIGCHEDQQKRFKNTVMGKVFAHPRSAAEKNYCESCHGPGKAHVEAGGGKQSIIRFGKDSNLSVQEKNAACLDCHSKGKQMFWKGSQHEAMGMACVDCHTVKAQKQPSMLAETRFMDTMGTEHGFTKVTQTELCLSCHKMKRAQMQRSSHMPFREGKISCSSCHNPHGSPNPKQLLQATVTDNCVSCHAERRGPFLWEHPVVMENCANCHEAHGSSNPQLLKVRQPRLCNECHITARHPTQPQTMNNKVFNRSCTNCHSQIHGSNHPSGNMYLR